jgi:hypothetical protein
MSKAQTALIVQKLFDSFSNAKIGPEHIRAYVEALEDLEPSRLHAAVIKAIQSSEYLPSIKAVREAAAAIIPDGHIDPELIWHKVHRAIRDVGFYRTPVFEDPLILKAIEGAMGSWQNLCDAPIDDRPSNRARIIQAYQILVKRAKEEEHMSPRLRGLISKAIEVDRARKAGITDLGSIMKTIAEEGAADGRSTLSQD